MRILPLFFVLLLVSILRAENGGAPLLKDKWSVISAFVGGAAEVDFRKYTSEVSGDQLAETPPWRQEDDRPPLAPRRAETLARAMLQEIMPGCEWFTPEVHMKPFTVITSNPQFGVRWIYVLTFQIVPRTAYEGGTFNAIVLMNGTVIRPKYVPTSNSLTDTTNPNGK